MHCKNDAKINENSTKLTPRRLHSPLLLRCLAVASPEYLPSARNTQQTDHRSHPPYLCQHTLSSSSTRPTHLCQHTLSSSSTRPTHLCQHTLSSSSTRPTYLCQHTLSSSSRRPTGFALHNFHHSTITDHTTETNSHNVMSVSTIRVTSWFTTHSVLYTHTQLFSAVIRLNRC